MHSVTTQLLAEGVGGMKVGCCRWLFLSFCHHLIVILQMDNEGFGIYTEKSGTLLQGHLFHMFEQITRTH
jgi:hypothetical protein